MSQNSQRIDLEAAQWAVRLHTLGLTEPEQAELDRWLEANPRHCGALLRARAAWVDLDRLAALAGYCATLRSAPDSPPPRESTQPPPSANESPRPPEEFSNATAVSSLSRQRTNRHWLAAAGVISLLVGITATWWIYRTQVRGEVYVSKVGEVRSVTLSDGSGMVLNTATEAMVRYGPSRREIELAAGEGLFEVAKDPKRPFIVRIGSVSVRALGTVFAVRALNHRVEVTVTEGVVELMDDSGSDAGIARRIAANESAMVTDNGHLEVQSTHPDQVERRLAWRQGMLKFAGEPLAKAVDEINQHNTRHIVVDDPAAASRPVVGLFRANDSVGFATSVATALGLQCVDGDDAIHLRSRSAH